MAVNDILTRVRDARLLNNVDADTFPQYLSQEPRSAARQYQIGSNFHGGALVFQGSAYKDGTVEYPGFIFHDATGYTGWGVQDPAYLIHTVGPIGIDNDADGRARALVLGQLTSGPVTGDPIGYYVIQDRTSGALFAAPVYSLNGSSLGGTTVDSAFPTLTTLWNITGVVNPADTFLRAATSLLQADQPASTSGDLWNTVAPGGTRKGSFRAKNESGVWIADLRVADAAFNGCWLDRQVADCTVYCTFPVVSAGCDSGVMVRYYTGTSTAWLFSMRATDYCFRSWNFSTDSWVDGGNVEWSIAKTPANGDRIKIDMSGNTFHVWIDAGSGFVDYSTHSMPALNTTTGVSHGLMGSWNTGCDVVRYDDWLCEL